MCFRWACRTILKSRLRRDRHACEWERRFSGRGRSIVNHRGHRERSTKVLESGSPVVFSCLDSVVNSNIPDDWCQFCGQSPATGQEERHHWRTRRCVEAGADRSSARRPSQRGLHRILRKSFGCAALFRYYSVRRNQPQKSDSGCGIVRGRSKKTHWKIVAAAVHLLPSLSRQTAAEAELHQEPL